MTRSATHIERLRMPATDFRYTLVPAEGGNYPLADTHSWLKMNIQRSWCVARYTLRKPQEMTPQAGAVPGGESAEADDYT